MDSKEETSKKSVRSLHRLRFNVRKEDSSTADDEKLPTTIPFRSNKACATDGKTAEC